MQGNEYQNKVIGRLTYLNELLIKFPSFKYNLIILHNDDVKF